MNKSTILSNLNDINNHLEKMTLNQVIKWLYDNFEQDKITLASSLGPQSIFLTYKINKIIGAVDAFFIDTLRHFEETYNLLERCKDFFSVDYRVFKPSLSEVNKYVEKYGLNGFYDSYQQRVKCCKIRKTQPLKRALQGYSGWITGIKNSDNENRKEMKILEWDDKHGLFKFNPLKNWKDKKVWRIIKENNLPYNSLHDEDYSKIGCKPCTLPDLNGGKRSGRWWWEKDTVKECGMHYKFEDEEDEEEIEPRSEFIEIPVSKN